MSHSRWLARGFVVGCIMLVAATPARSQGLIEAFVEGFNEGLNDSGYDDHDNHNFDNHSNHNHNGYHPNYNSNTHLHKVWVGDHWEYVPHTVPNGNVVYPSYPSNNVVYPSTTVVNTTPTVVSNALPYKGPGVTIALEEEVGGTVNYVIDGKESATIQAGQQQTLTAKGKYEIRFSRGKSEEGRDFGQARYTITEGNYHFTVTDKGWELLRDKEQPNLVTTQAQAASPSGIKTNALPPKNALPTAPGAAQPANQAPAPADTGAPAANTVPAAKSAAAVSPAPAAPAAGG